MIVMVGKHLGTLKEHDTLESLLDSKAADYHPATHVVNVVHGDDTIESNELFHGVKDSNKSGVYGSVIQDEDDAVVRERTISQISADGNGGHGYEFASRTPWGAFFSHPASITLLVNAWTAVSIFIIIILFSILSIFFIDD